MSIIYTGGEGKPLRDILNELGNPKYDTIYVRLRDQKGVYDNELLGFCAYDGNTLTPLDGDSYSLDDRYVEWEEGADHDEKYLVIWESCEYEMQKE